MHTKEINKIRLKQSKGEKIETPYYIKVVKEELGKIDKMFSFPK